MKTKLNSLRILFLLIASLSTFALSLRANENGTTSSVKLSAPDKPATLRIELPWADTHITGVDGDTVTVVSTLKQQGAEKTSKGGMRRLDDETSFELTEHDNVVALHLASEGPWAGGSDAIFNISLPRAMALAVAIEHGGEIIVKEVSGDIEINNMNGGVQLEGVTGSAIVNTMNGEVRAHYTTVPQKLVSITSMNGEVDLSVPAETKANVQLRTQNGSILTDFDQAVLKTKSEGKRSNNADAARRSADAAQADADAARASADADRANALAAPSPDVAPIPRPPRPPRPPMPPLTGGKLVSGTLNGGGVDIKISSMNGEITLRQSNKSATASDSNTKNNVTVIFHDPDNFTDAADRTSMLTSTDVLNELRDYVQKTAAPLLVAGSKLTVTFLDLDLAGMIRPDRNNIRVMTATTIPRAHIKFKLLGADDQVLKEGEVKLSDLNYQQNIGIIGRNDELYYDKELLKEWIRKEFRKGS